MLCTSRARRLSLALLIALGVSSSAAATRAEPRVELITIGAGDELWTTFGHTALRVLDEALGQDAVYNYGVADFGRPSFVWSTLRGRSRYMLVQFSWQQTVLDTLLENRTLYRQPLNLTRTQAHQMADFLAWNALSENREYVYDHLLDNCSTRVRDALDRITHGALWAVVGDQTSDWTYRDHVLASAAGHLYNLLAVDLVGGPNQSKRANAWALMFLPEHLMYGAAAAIVDPARELRLAQPAEVVIQRRGPPARYGSRYRARTVLLGSALLWAALVLGLSRGAVGASLPARLAGRMAGLLVALTAALCGTIGLAYAVLGLVSVLPDTHWNENVWVFWPLDFWWGAAGLAWLARGRLRLKPLLRSYLSLRIVGLAGYAALKPTGLFPQDNWVLVASVGLLLLAVRYGSTCEGSTAHATCRS